MAEPYATDFTITALVQSLNNARIPKPHAASHKDGEPDALKLTDLAVADNVTTHNATTSRPGLCPTGEGTGTKILNDNIEWVDIPTGNSNIAFPNSSSVVLSGNNTWIPYVASGSAFKPWVTVGIEGSGADYECDGVADNVQFQGALNAIALLGGGTLLVLPGTYNLSSRITYSGSNLQIRGTGHKCVLDFSGLGTTDTAIYIAGGLSSTSSALASNVSINDHTITVSNGSYFSANDYIRLRCETNYHVTDGVAVQQHGEIHQVESVDGNVLTLKDVALLAHTTAASGRVDKLNMRNNILLENFRMVGSDIKEQNAIVTDYIWNNWIKDMVIEDFVDRAIYVNNSVNIHVGNNVISGSDKAGLGYGVCIGDCSRNSTVTHNKFSNCRHGMTAVGTYTYGVLINSVWAFNSQSYDKYAIGMNGHHNTTDGMLIYGNTCNGCSLGFFRGNNTQVIANHVHNAPACDGIEIYEEATNVLIENNNFIISGTGYPVMVHHDCNRVTIKGNNMVSDWSGVYAEGGLTNSAISGNNVNSNSTCLYIRTSNATKDSSGINITDNVLETDTGSGIILEAAGGYDLNDININDNTIKVTNGHVSIKINNGTPAKDVNHLNISGNMCIGGASGGIGIALANASDVFVHGNHIRGADKGVHIITACSDYAVINNKFKSCTTDIDDDVVDATRTITPNITTV